MDPNTVHFTRASVASVLAGACSTEASHFYAKVLTLRYPHLHNHALIGLTDCPSLGRMCAVEGGPPIASSIPLVASIRLFGLFF